jgi:hypothetical protein
MTSFADLWQAGRLRAKRRYLLARAIRRRRRHLTPRVDRTAQIRKDDILLFATIRNEAARLPFFLRHYRALGVNHFLFVDNASTDGSPDALAAEPDVSLWTTRASYRGSRFGMDWLNGLLARHGSGHWCLTVDADELLLIPHGDRATLRELTVALDARGLPMMAAMMLDLYPEGPLSTAHAAPGEDPTQALPLFDAEGYDWEYQPKFGNISIRGGVRQRVFFADAPDRAPHLHKTPLIRWHWRYAYVSSTHIALPRRLNAGFDARLQAPTGVLLHTKFLGEVIAKSRDEKLRREHFTHAERYDGYYDGIIADPVLRDAQSHRLSDWRGLEALGLMTRGNWSGPNR